MEIREVGAVHKAQAGCRARPYSTLSRHFTPPIDSMLLIDYSDLQLLTSDS
jgi:hypothetical protein